ncbi:MAG TPA: 2-dehydro-3-deoxy-D-gluconate 5-dehydrogenase KduD [Steroidobacteraceae bacterium]|nr:2-dehydro-3-deoxy-D-gluconate 5-dehydrogenase KduD [Steroidobacteraceae bacterium]
MSDKGSPFDLSGRVAAVTGANTGLGQAIALALAEAGADIATLGRTEPVETAARIAALGRASQHFAVDLGAHPDFEPLVRDVVVRFGAVDILVNNAGTIRRAEALDFQELDWDAVINVNLKSVFFLTQAVARTMIGRGRGKIINIASMLSFQGGIRVAAYTASKSAIAGLTRLLANEWAARGINVNAIAPGYMATENTAALRADTVRNREILGRIPAGRWGDPADLAGAAVFLASGASDYVHGAILPVDGGWLAR